MTTLLIKDVRPWGDETADVLVEEGIIHEVRPGLTPKAPDAVVIDGNNQLLVPGLVDGHIHLDKTLWGLPWRDHQAGSRLTDRIEHERSLRQALNLSPQLQAERLIRQAISRGTTHLRTHVDIDPQSGLTNFEGIVAAREAMRDFIDVQIVAFPQSGLLIQPGTLDLLEAAVKDGAEVVGGLDPAGIDRDPVRHLDAIFALADRYGVAIDIHLHDPGALGAFELELIIERTQALALQGRVAVSHAFCLGMIDDVHLRRLADQLREQRIAIMTHGPGNREFPPIRPLTEAGVHLFTGSDNIRDAWSPFGTADMLERIWILSYRSNLKRDEAIAAVFKMATFNGATVIGTERYGLTIGCRADLVIMEGETLTEAVMNRAPRKCVVKNGRVVAAEGQCLF